MRISSRIALVSSLSLVLFSTAALALGPSTAPLPGGPGGTPPGHTACTGIDCPQPEASNLADCSDRLLSLPHVTGRQIEAIDEDQRIHIAPVCDMANRSLTDVKPSEASPGNVAGLLTSIEANPLVMAELRRHGYRSIDVIGILLGSNAAVLYVHKA
ncbi:MAG: hypothetical protein P4M09_26615 [Devosia sp.]|nr:hypothetical protein [Devosia sp.]